ncbi:TadE-like protein [Neorhodopirellula lusitana]|uniref:TadE-like protein n=1 Tax=Neorhodopirellula lusitana TaxID=445327 RepID=A0ABY1QNX4_9BACT|nr:TadE family protein [Neorhodopirellula lusitana]SMP76569.1 TadE-like protein [Neorhodopirellula lusitana]
MSISFSRLDRRVKNSANRRRRQTRRLRWGIAATELAIGLPVILLFGMGTMEMCTMIRLRQKLKTIAYEGARVSILPEAERENVDYQCELLANDQSINGCSISMDPVDPTSLDSGDWCTVSAQAPFTQNSMTGAWMLSTFSLNESVSIQKP